MKPATFENAIEFASDLIRIPSLPGSEGDVARRVVAEYEALGFEDVRIDEAGNALGVVRGGGTAPALMLSCHLDIVAPGDAETWEYPPFGGVVTDTDLHGRGAMDIKGPLALQTYAAAAVAGQAPGDVIVAHTVLEERGGWGMRHLVESGTVAPAVVVIGEATQGDIAIGHRGRGEMEIVIRGVAGHASAPDRAANALDLLGSVLDGVRSLNAGEAADPVLGRATAVATGVDVRPESRNVIPDEVVVVVDWRILPGDTEADLLERLSRHVGDAVGTVPEGFAIEVRTGRERQHTYTGLTSERLLFTPGFLMDSDDPVVTAASRAVGRRGSEEQPAVARPWQFATDGGWTCGVHGIPTVGFAPGDEKHAHTNTERLDLEEARWAFSRYPDLITALQRQVAG